MTGNSLPVTTAHCASKELWSLQVLRVQPQISACNFSFVPRFAPQVSGERVRDLVRLYPFQEDHSQLLPPSWGRGWHMGWQGIREVHTDPPVPLCGDHGFSISFSWRPGTPLKT